MPALTYHGLDEVDGPPGPAAVLLHGPLVVVDVAPVKVHLGILCGGGVESQATRRPMPVRLTALAPITSGFEGSGSLARGRFRSAATAPFAAIWKFFLLRLAYTFVGWICVSGWVKSAAFLLWNGREKAAEGVRVSLNRDTQSQPSMHHSS